MRILITGANGFIGSHLIDYLLNLEYEVVALSRTLIVGRRPGLYAYQWELGAALPHGATLNLDCAIHLAHDFNGTSGAIKTSQHTVGLMYQLKSLGVPKQLFFSSYSAGQHATSIYGKTKYKIEQEAHNVENVTILRPGVVMGDSGIFGRIANIVKIFPIIPLPDGGVGTVPIISIGRLCYETIAIIQTNEKIAYANIFEPELFTLKEIVKKIANSQKKKILIFPVPSALIIFMLKVLDYLPYKLSVNADNLSGFLANQEADHLSTLKNSDAKLWK